jgi:hypothetical protein
LSNGTDTVIQNLTSHVTWTTANSLIATVNSSGYVRSSGTGTTQITALYSSGSGSVPGNTVLTVTGSPLQTLTVSPAAITIFRGDTVPSFTAEGALLEDPTPVDYTSSVTWSSSNRGVAEISNTPGSEGLVTTGTKTGTAMIKATDPITGKSGSSTLSVE